MFTTAIGLRGQANNERWVATKPVAACRMLGTLILVGVAVNATIVIADSNLRQPAFDRRACSVIPEALAC